MYVDRVNNKREETPRKTIRQRWRFLALLLAGSSLMAASGCTAWTGVKNAWSYSGYWNEGMMGYRHTAYASKAWHSRKHCYANQNYLKDFARGFKAGYISVADGGDGCTPAFPPREYWGWKYQSAEGQARVAAWFSGFPYGAKAAEEDGVGGWTQIQSSSRIQNQYVQHGRMPSEYNGMYPVPPIQANGSPLPSRSVMSSEVIESSILEVDPATGGQQQYPLEPLLPISDPSIH
jgi:hypothetical protein